jgi:NADH-quinone oxidoreductase subunit A
MLGDYLPILIHSLVVVALGAAMLGVSAWVGVKRPSREKLAPYECGIPPVGNARERFSISFYLIGMLFILFDVEVAFLFPWAVVARSLKWFGFIEMSLYIVILLAGYVYIWKKGALDWSR